MNLDLIDNSLSVGPYLIKEYSNNKLVLAKNNDINVEIKGGNNRYTIYGIHIDIDENASNEIYVLNKYKKGLIDYAKVPVEQIKNERDLLDTHYLVNSNSITLNLNTCDEMLWEELFGVNGNIVKTNLNDYWNVKPAMSNDNFIKGLKLAINRNELAEINNTTPTLSYFSNYFSSDAGHLNPYNYSTYHNEALLNYYGSEEIINNFGYDLEKARKYFSMAANELLQSGKYKVGDTIEIEICWQTNQYIIDYATYIENYLENAFNDHSVCNNQLSLDIINTSVVVWSDIFYNKLFNGHYDMAQGMISAGTFNSINAFETFKSNNTSNLTLNWGVDTNSINLPIEYNGKQFSYNALWAASDHGTYINLKGAESNIFDATILSNTLRCGKRAYF